MASILIVDDRSANREFLVTLLGYSGYSLLEAADGAEGLEITRAKRPDLVIADILMPTMDGYEFVRQLRADPAIADTRVIFYTAQYHEPEARKLAMACGVSDVLIKPCAPELVLQTVKATLGRALPSASSQPEDEFDREHLQVVTNKLSQKADELLRTNERLNAMMELGLQLGSERDPGRLLQVFCDASREIVGARYALVGIPNNGEYRYFLTSGMDAMLAARVGRPTPLAGVLGSVLAGGRCFRVANHSELATTGVPRSFPPAQAILAAPVSSPVRIHGWISLLDKLGAEAFTNEDERLIGVLAAQVGRIYENGSLYADLLRQTSALTKEIADRKRAEDERDRLFQESLSLLGVLGFNGRFMQLNPAWERTLGYTRAELMAQPFMNMVHPDDLARTHGEVERLAQGVISTSFENRLRCEDGTYRSFLWNGTPFLDRHCFSLSGHDITIRRKLAAERDALLGRLQLHIERMPLAYMLFDADLRSIDWNPAAERIFGYTKTESLGMRPLDLVPPAFWEKGSELLARIRAGDMAAHSVNENLTKDGRTIICEWFNTPLTSETGQFVGLLCLAQDISARREAEESLRLRDRAIQAVTQGILITDPSQPDNLIVYASPGFLRLTGYSSEEVIGRNCRFLQGKDTDPAAVARVRMAIQVGEPCTVELLNYRKDGTEFWNELSISPVRDDAACVTHFVGVQADVTSRRSLEEQFRQAQKMEAVGRLAGGVAHDFNNLLTVINGYSELLIERLSTNDESRELVVEINSAGERSAGLTRQLLAFSRQQILAPQILVLNEVVNETDKMLRRLIGEDIGLSITLAPNLWTVLADPGQIEQVLMNLAVNARDAMPTGGRLMIQTQNVELEQASLQIRMNIPSGPHVLLSITDTGSGMPAEVKARIFEPFFTTKGEYGTGLGLATVHGIIKQAGGHLSVDSEVGHGTSFKVYLPRVENRSSPSKIRTGQSLMQKGGETILLVEDEEGVRGLACRILRSCGYTVLETSDGINALRIAEERQKPIDLLVTDVVMPRMSGRVMAERLAEVFPGIKVLFLSGYTDDSVVRNGILETEVAFLQKPFTPASLTAKVREILDG